jgi:hypothetical protein
MVAGGMYICIPTEWLSRVEMKFRHIGERNGTERDIKIRHGRPA